MFVYKYSILEATPLGAKVYAGSFRETLNFRNQIMGLRPDKRNPVPIPRPKRQDKTVQPWQQQEQEGERILGGERTRGSGCGNQKGDVRTRLLVCEMKTTSEESRRIKLEEICKLCREAGPKVPVFAFGFDKMPRSFSSDWFALPAEKFDIVMTILNAVERGDMEEAQKWLRIF
jgi:hypothetical protein